MNVESRWIRNAADEYAVSQGCYFDEAAAERVCKFFRTCLRHSKGQWAGQPFEPLEWQRLDVIYPLFGWKRPDGRRRFSKAYIEIPKKNGKSTLAAALAIYLMLADSEPGAEVYTCARNAKQSAIVFRESSQMVETSPNLNAVCKINRSTGRIVFPRKYAWIQALHGEAGSQEGLNIHGLIFDELHTQKTRELWDALKYGGEARRQPLLIAITTAGVSRESICWEQHQYSLRVNSGEIADISHFAYIRSADETDDWTAETTWFKANPSLGHTISVEKMREACLEAQNTPAAENGFRRYRLNQWCEQETRWIALEAWLACKRRFALKKLRGEPCYGGLDLASHHDLAAFVLVFPRPKGRVIIVPQFWTTTKAVRRRGKLDATPFAPWVAQKFLNVSKGKVISQAPIRKAIVKASELYDLREVAYDRWNSSEIVNFLEADGVEMVAYSQSAAHMNAPLKQLEGLILDKKIAHADHPVMNWCLGNLAVSENSDGHLKPDRKASKDKIDGVTATLMGLARMTFNMERNEAGGITVL